MNGALTESCISSPFSMYILTVGDTGSFSIEVRSLPVKLALCHSV